MMIYKVAFGVKSSLASLTSKYWACLQHGRQDFPRGMWRINRRRRWRRCWKRAGWFQVEHCCDECVFTGRVERPARRHNFLRDKRKEWKEFEWAFYMLIRRKRNQQPNACVTGWRRALVRLNGISCRHPLLRLSHSPRGTYRRFPEKQISVSQNPISWSVIAFILFTKESIQLAYTTNRALCMGGRKPLNSIACHARSYNNILWISDADDPLVCVLHPFHTQNEATQLLSALLYLVLCQHLKGNITAFTQKWKET